MRQPASAKERTVAAPPLRCVPEDSGAPGRPLRADASYLITGGLGGAGLALCEWMAERGARHLALVGRSEASVTTRGTLARLECSGARIEIVNADVARRDELEHALEIFARALPPLRGVVHAAGVLDDAILLRLDPERMRAVMAPKVAGAWNLHSATLPLSLDFFVLFSSGAGLLGSPGQGSYAAANSFLDALSHHRRSCGLPALSINWTYWVGFGMVASAEKTRLLQRMGVDGLTRPELMEAFERLLAQPASQIAVLPVSWRRYAEGLPAGAASASSLVRGLLPSSRPGAGAAEERSAPARPWPADPVQRKQRLESLIAGHVGHALEIPASQVEKHLPLTSLGLDSLMALELRNRLEIETGVAVPVVTLLEDVGVAELAAHVMELLPEATPGSLPAPPPVALLRANGNGRELPVPGGIDSERAEEILARLGDLPDAAVDSLLNQLLD